MRYFVILLGFIFITSCDNVVNEKLDLGWYVGNLEVEKDKYLPFDFSVINDSTLVVSNSSELVEFKVCLLYTSDAADE